MNAEARELLRFVWSVYGSAGSGQRDSSDTPRRSEGRSGFRELGSDEIPPERAPPEG